MDRREILDYVECWLNGEWYETPISFDGLARSLRAANTHHGSAVHFKAQVVASTFARTRCCRAPRCTSWPYFITLAMHTWSV